MTKNDWRYMNDEKTVVEMKLTRGKTMQFDADDFAKASQYTWCTDPCGGIGYAATEVAGKKLLFHHLVIGKPSKPLVVDHIDGNTLDNRKCNLRFVTPKQNTNNRRMDPRNRTGVNGLRLISDIKSKAPSMYCFTWREAGGCVKRKAFRFIASPFHPNCKYFSSAEEALIAATDFATEVRARIGNTNGIRPAVNVSKCE